jgi:uncharacterized protein YjbI with pentapeptide repeats
MLKLKLQNQSFEVDSTIFFQQENENFFTRLCSSKIATPRNRDGEVELHERDFRCFAFLLHLLDPKTYEFDEEVFAVDFDLIKAEFDYYMMMPNLFLSDVLQQEIDSSVAKSVLFHEEKLSGLVLDGKMQQVVSIENCMLFFCRIRNMDSSLLTAKKSVFTNCYFISVVITGKDSSFENCIFDDCTIDESSNTYFDRCIFNGVVLKDFCNYRKDDIFKNCKFQECDTDSLLLSYSQLNFEHEVFDFEPFDKFKNCEIVNAVINRAIDVCNVQFTNCVLNWGVVSLFREENQEYNDTKFLSCQIRHVEFAVKKYDKVYFKKGDYYRARVNYKFHVSFTNNCVLKSNVIENSIKILQDDKVHHHGQQARSN